MINSRSRSVRTQTSTAAAARPLEQLNLSSSLEATLEAIGERLPYVPVPSMDFGSRTREKTLYYLHVDGPQGIGEIDLKIESFTTLDQQYEHRQLIFLEQNELITRNIKGELMLTENGRCLVLSSLESLEGIVSEKKK